tara:strand:- start:4178 stop:4594 length:417 start_codon:yes stop_codon:yes gene_type:complete
MKIISHRGNLYGREVDNENKPEFIMEALRKFEVEVDVWFVNDSWFLGHDKPQYLVDLNFFNQRMWLHCKNMEAFSELSKTDGLNYFWHENDKVTITSLGVPWCNLGTYIDSGITVIFEHKSNLPKCLGVCTDYPMDYL